jgi:hypothetical protein
MTPEDLDSLRQWAEMHRPLGSVQARQVLELMDAFRANEDAAFAYRPLSIAYEKLRDAIVKHHRQKADDRCIEDDDRLYAAAGLPPCDRRVGDKAAMLKNCERFINARCEGGGWMTYAELEAELAKARAVLNGIAPGVIWVGGIS